jgi:hypothetical protein
MTKVTILNYQRINEYLRRGARVHVGLMVRFDLFKASLYR